VVTLTAPTNGASYLRGANVELTATASAVNGGVTNVTFLRELTKLGEDATAPYALTWVGVPAGQFALRAVAVDGFGMSATSAPVNVSIATTLGTNGFLARVNFQLDTAPLFPGYVPDYGQVFGVRTNGYTYGWNVDNTANSRHRNAANSYDLRYDTLNHMQKPGGGTTWQIAVPNGAYQVRIVSGDPSNFDGTFQLTVEGMLLVSGTPTSAARWIEGIGVVTVNDGLLTVGNAPNAVNNKICFIEITALPPEVPPIWLTSSTLVTSNALHFWLQGGEGATYVVEATTDFNTWAPVYTNTTTGGLLEFVEPAGSNVLRFFRARQQP
jgi:hypothetical protein